MLSSFPSASALAPLVQPNAAYLERRSSSTLNSCHLSASGSPATGRCWSSAFVFFMNLERPKSANLARFLSSSRMLRLLRSLESGKDNRQRYTTTNNTNNISQPMDQTPPCEKRHAPLQLQILALLTPMMMVLRVLYVSKSLKHWIP